jgi:uncharacterized protein YabE (DUF348 family)
VRKRLVAVAVYGVVTAGLVAGTTAFVTLDKTVSISDDGTLIHVHTYASSVHSVLRRAGISVGVHDQLTPSLSAAVHNGSTISIHRGRPLDLTIDGTTRQVWVTADDVSQALQQAGIRDPLATISADRSARVPLTGMAIDIDLSHTVIVQADGTTRAVVSTQPTLGAVLTEAGIVVNPADQVSVPLLTRPYDGLEVAIVRLTTAQQSETSTIPFTSVTKPDPNSLIGTKTVAQVGENGILVRIFQLSFTDGVQTAKTLATQQVTVAPVQQVITVGIKPKPVPKPIPKPIPKPRPVFKAKPKPAAAFAVAADGLDWHALAACESGGRATASNGTYYGLYQFRVGTWRAVGGSGLPSQASASEQTYRAQLLYKRSSWHSQWPVCGSALFH